MKKYLPVMLDVTHKKILLLGGGKASAEKLRTLEQLGQKIKVISPEFQLEFYEKPWLDLVHRKYVYGDLDGFDVVYCGINDPCVESLVSEEAKEKKILVNFIDKVEDSDFISAASIIKSSFTLFISTYGKAPGGAKLIREELEKTLDLDSLDSTVSGMAKERKKKKEAHF